MRDKSPFQQHIHNLQNPPKAEVILDVGKAEEQPDIDPDEDLDVGEWDTPD